MTVVVSIGRLSATIHLRDGASYWMRYAESVVPLESWYKSERRWAWRKSWARKERTSFSPVYVCNTELASSTSPMNKATIMTRKAARMSTATSERTTAAGSAPRSEEHTS